MPLVCHIQDCLESGIDPQLIELNFQPIHGSLAYERMRGRVAKRLQTGNKPLNKPEKEWYDAYDATEGWLTRGEDVLNDYIPSDYCRYKATIGQLIDPKTGKVLKYVTPRKEGLHPFFPIVPRYIWEKVAKRYGRTVNYSLYKSFWHWVKIENIPIYLTEGEKKACKLLTEGFAAISIPGIWTGTVRNLSTGKFELREELKEFDTLGREIFVLFDHETDPKKLSSLQQAASRLACCFHSAKSQVGYVPGPEKGIDDYLVAGGKVEDIKFKSRWEITAENYRKFTYKPDILINEKYLGEIDLPKGRLIFLQAPKGSGKTEVIAKFVSRGIGEGRRSLAIYHRRTIARANGERFGIPFIADHKGFLAPGHDKDLGFTLCINSLHPDSLANINFEEWDGATAILDEFNSTLWSMLNDRTLKKHRQKILETFRALIRHILATGGTVIVADADLSDLSCDFLLALCDFPVKPFVIANNYKPEKGYNLTVFDDKDPCNLFAKACSLIEQGKKIWIQTGGQKVTSGWGTILLEMNLKARYPHLKILRIDSETVDDKTHPAFGATGCINQIVSQYDVVISSPSISSGVSIDVECFDAWFGISYGNTPIFEFLQSTFRIRQFIPRYVWIADRGCYKLGEGECNPKSLLASKDRNIRTHLKFLRLELELNTDNDIFQKTWAKMAAMINAAYWNYKESVIKFLKAEGHTVVIHKSDDSSKQIKEEMKVIKKVAIESEAVAVAQAKDLTDVEFEDLENQMTRTQDERLSEKKYKLRKRYGVEPTKELKILNDKRGWYLSILRHYLITHNPKFLEARDKKQLTEHLNNCGGKTYLPDLKLDSVGITMLKNMGLLKFCEPNRVWTKQDSEVQEFVGLCIKMKNEIKEYLGITISEALAEISPLKIIQSLLKLLGLKLVCVNQRRLPGSRDRVREFCFGGFLEKLEAAADPNLRTDIHSVWERRDTEALAKAEAIFSYGVAS